MTGAKKEVDVMDGKARGTGQTDLIEHQLNNRLGIIVGLCDLLLRATPPTDDRHADLREIRDASEHVTQLVSELVDGAR
jgi:signal transduction histidine kinase